MKKRNSPQKEQELSMKAMISKGTFDKLQSKPTLLPKRKDKNELKMILYLIKKQIEKRNAK